MTTLSPKLGLVLPYGPDAFSTTDIRNNWSQIDTAPGSYICTSSTRPTWTTAQAGRKIMESNTGLDWWWDGAAWKRLTPSGLLLTTSGAPAIALRNTVFSTTSSTYVVVTSVANVVIPGGMRPLKIEARWNSASNASGTTYGAIFQSATNNSGPVLYTWNFATYGTTDYAAGGTNFAILPGGLAAGTYSFSFQALRGNNTGTSVINGYVGSEISLMCVEL